MHEQASATNALIERLDAAVTLGDVDRITGRIKQELETVTLSSKVRLPQRYQRCCPDSYARRLLHRNTELGYTIVVMTWGPGQQTGLHDHAGIWCVECVIEGELDVTQYRLVQETADGYRFDKVSRVRAGVGDAGCLIPPFEYHVLSNALKDRRSMTVHVYGGEMDHCNLFVPDGAGRWNKVHKDLAYDD